MSGFNEDITSPENDGSITNPDIPDTGERGDRNSSTYAPIIVYDIRSAEPDVYYFLLEWGPDDGDPENVMKVAIPAQRVVGDDEWVSVPYMIPETLMGLWYKLRVSTVNSYGWRSITLPIEEGWVYQRAGNDEDDLARFDEVVNILPNSDFEFDELLNGDFELPYWTAFTGSNWSTPIVGDGSVEQGSFGRITDYNLILKPGQRIRSDIISVYPERPYALSGYFVQAAAGLSNFTFRLSYYTVGDSLLEQDYVLEGEDSFRAFDPDTWFGGTIFQARDRVGGVFFPPPNASYVRVELINEGTSDIWADDLMLSQTPNVTPYVSWDRESIESYIETKQYRENIPPSGTIDFESLTPIQAYINEDGSADIKIRWNYEEGTYKATGFVVFGNLADRDTQSVTPTESDHDFAYKLANASANKFDLVGVNPLNRYSFAIAPYATTRQGMTLGDIVHYEVGANSPLAPDQDDWVDFQGASVIDLQSAPRTQVDVVSESDTSVVLEFTVTAPNGEDTTTFYRLEPTGSFEEVPVVGSNPRLTVLRDKKDVVVYYYSQGETTGRAESVLEFVIDTNRVPTITHTDSEYDTATQEAIVYWYGDEDVESVEWQIDSGSSFTVPGRSGDTGWFSIVPGEVKTVTLTPSGRNQQGDPVAVTIAAPVRPPTINLTVSDRQLETITLDFEVEGFGDSQVIGYYRLQNTGPYAQIPVISGAPQLTIDRDQRNLNLQYFASGTLTNLVSEVQNFLIDINRRPQIIDADVDLDTADREYVVRWFADDDTDYVTYQVNSGAVNQVVGTLGATPVQSINYGEKHEVTLTPFGPTGSGVSISLYPYLAATAAGNIPPTLVISGVTTGSDGGGEFVLVDLFSYDQEGSLSGNIEYAEGNAVFTDSSQSTYQHKVYRPASGEIPVRYRSYLGTLYSDTILFSVDEDQLPEIRPSIGLSADQSSVRIEWDGDDDVNSVGIIPSGSPERFVNQQSGFDETDSIGPGGTAFYTIRAYTGAGGTGKQGRDWPLTVTKAFGGAPWVSIAKDSEDNNVSPATITLVFNADATADGLYYTTTDGLKPGDSGWTSVAEDGTVEFDRPEGTTSTVVRAYAERDGLYSTVATFTIDPDEVPSVTRAWYTQDWDNSQATLNWDIDDDTSSVQLYLEGSAEGSPISSATTSTTVSGMDPGVVKVYTIVPIRGTTEFPQNAKTVVIFRPDEFAFDGVLSASLNANGTADLTLTISGNPNAFDVEASIYEGSPTSTAIQTHTFTADGQSIDGTTYASLNDIELPTKSSKKWWARLVNSKGDEKWLFTSADRDKIPGGNVQVIDNYSASPIIRCQYDGDTEQIVISTPSGDRTYSGLTGGGSVEYEVGVTNLNTSTPEPLLNDDEERDGYEVTFSGGGTSVPMFNGSVSGKESVSEGGESGNYVKVIDARWKFETAQTMRIDVEVEVGPNTYDVLYQYTDPTTGDLTPLSGIFVVIPSTGVRTHKFTIYDDQDVGTRNVVEWDIDSLEASILLTPRTNDTTPVSGSVKSVTLGDPSDIAEGAVRVTDQAGTQSFKRSLTFQQGSGLDVDSTGNTRVMPSDINVISNTDPSAGWGANDEGKIWIKPV